MGRLTGELNRRIFKRLGIQVIRHEPPVVVKFLNHFGFDTVIDVGANIGQFAQTLIHYQFDGRIYSVEPYSKAHQELIRKSQNLANWQIIPRCALGKADGFSKLNISQNSYSSSILQILPKHTGAAPDSFYIEDEPISIQTLDGVFNSAKFLSRKCLLKIDVQGFEEEVLAGGKSLLTKVGGVKIELSLAELYEGQASYKQLLNLLESYGFHIWNLEPGFRNPVSGETYQFDVIMVHHSVSSAKEKN
jgi:FkbM family methyltransferase